MENKGAGGLPNGGNEPPQALRDASEVGQEPRRNDDAVRAAEFPDIVSKRPYQLPKHPVITGRNHHGFVERRHLLFGLKGESQTDLSADIVPLLRPIVFVFHAVFERVQKFPLVGQMNRVANE